MKAATLALLMLMLASGPLFAQQPVQRPPFPVPEYNALEARKGAGVVTGQVVLNTRFGPRHGADEVVLLNPVTSYSVFWYEKHYLDGEELAEPDDRLSSYTISTTTDGAGNFRFGHVPAGEYFLTSGVKWTQADRATGREITRNETITQRVRVEDGQTLQVVLSRED